MLLLAVVPEPLPVVREDDEERPVVEAPAREVRDERPEDRVGECDLSVVRARRGAPVGLRRIVGSVGLVEVHEQEERAVRDPVQPRESRPHRLGTGSLDGARGARPGGRVDAVVVDVERRRKARRSPENEGGDGRPRPVPARREERREGRMLPGVEREADVVPHAVPCRIEPREDRRVRRECQWTGTVRALEDDAVARDRVQRRGRGPAAPVDREVVRTQGVDRNENDGGAARPRLLRRGVAAPRAARARGQDQEHGEAAGTGHAKSRCARSGSRRPPSRSAPPGSRSSWSPVRTRRP